MGLDEPTLRAACVPRRYRPGEIVFHEGDSGGALHLIERGRVAVRLTTPAGDVATLDVLQAGDTFGEQALVDGIGERTATVTALGPVATMSLGRARFDELRTQHPGLDRFLASVLAVRLQATSRQLLDALFLPADVRVARCVARLHTMFATDGSDSVPFTQSEIASMAGVTRSTANRVLNRARTQGVLRVGRASLEVLDVERLRRDAGLAVSSR